jgi:hypothetical protein
MHLGAFAENAKSPQSNHDVNPADATKMSFGVRRGQLITAVAFLALIWFLAPNALHLANVGIIVLRVLQCWAD